MKQIVVFLAIVSLAILLVSCSTEEPGVMGPSDRFVDNGDGTVTDTAPEGLIWLKNANCLGGPLKWQAAKNVVAALAAGSCGLTDNSKAGDWCLPTLLCPEDAEDDMCDLYDAVDDEFGAVFGPSQCGPPFILNTAGLSCWTEDDPFSGVEAEIYWSSTTSIDAGTEAWGANLADRIVKRHHKKNESHRVWPVRGGVCP